MAKNSVNKYLLYLSNNIPECVLLLLFFVISGAYQFHETLFLPPYGHHMWRQSDCLSIALNYFNEGLSFFNPRIHFQGIQEGRGVSEFTGVYYINALIWYVLGQVHPFTLRWTNLFFFYTGIYAIYILFKKSTNSSWWATIGALVFFCSPLFVYYGTSYLTNSTSFSFVLIAWYFFERYKTSKKLFSFLCFSLFVALAGLLRITMLVGVLPIFLYLFVEWLRTSLWLFKRKYIWPILGFVGVLFSWYTYVQWYNEWYGSTYFLTSLQPLWKASAKEVAHVLNAMRYHLLPVLYPKPFLLSLAFIWLSFFFFWRKLLRLEKIILGTMPLGLLAYFSLWFKNFDVHDYYLIEFLFFPFSLFYVLSSVLRRQAFAYFDNRALKVCSIVLLCVLFAYGYVYTNIRYKSADQVVGAQFILSQEEIDHWNWVHFEQFQKYEGFKGIQPKMRSIGIQRSDKMISIPDASPNITLTLLDQKGFTDLYFIDIYKADRIELFKQKGAKYLAVNNTKLLKESWIKPYLEHLVLKHNNIFIYRL